MSESETAISKALPIVGKDIFELWPTPAILLDLQGNILRINRSAHQFFHLDVPGISVNTLFASGLFVDFNHTMQKILNSCSNPIPEPHKIMLRLPDKVLICSQGYAVFADQAKEHILLQLIAVQQRDTAYFSEIRQSFSTEMQKLKPYLNKPGKEMMNQIIRDFTRVEEINFASDSFFHLDSFEKERLEKILILFPELTDSELILCAFLSHNLSISDVAKLTGKTSNSLRVLFHRMLRKTNYSNGRDFIRRILLLD